jgi:hypothetical protein
MLEAVDKDHNILNVIDEYITKMPSVGDESEAAEPPFFFTLKELIVDMRSRMTDELWNRAVGVFAIGEKDLAHR